jgi:SAM-dependent methyltransferase
MNDGFYRAFEERYYAPREVIKELRKQYLSFTQHLANIYPGSPTFDAGCGRGEWLELMIEQGFLPTGVDLDDGMLSACIELQLPAKKGDAIAHMSSLADESQSVITAFHVVEHVSFEQLRKFVSEAQRVLKPGGLLIMETPNPENIAVATRNFYLDPTHQRPIPAQLLAFVAEFAGFERVKTLRLQEHNEIATREIIGLTEVINCVSPDYAIVAQKMADASVLAGIQDLFAADYGISLDTLSLRLDKRLDRIESQSIQSIELAQQAEAKAKRAEAKAQQAEAKAQQAENDSQQFLTQLHAVYGSTSWRITAPLRWLYGQARLLRQEGLKVRIKAFIKKVLRKINHELLLRPGLRKQLIGWFKILGFEAWLKSLHAKAHGQHASSSGLGSGQSSLTRQMGNLPPRAQQIYDNLKRVIELQKQGGK